MTTKNRQKSNAKKKKCLSQNANFLNFPARSSTGGFSLM